MAISVFPCDTNVPEPTNTEISDALLAQWLKQPLNPACHYARVDHSVVTDKNGCSNHRGYNFYADFLHHAG